MESRSAVGYAEHFWYQHEETDRWLGGITEMGRRSTGGRDCGRWGRQSAS